VLDVEHVTAYGDPSQGVELHREGLTMRVLRPAATTGVAIAILAVVVAAPAVAVAGSASRPASTGPYVVRAGDTLSGIARRRGSTVRAIAAANGLRNPNLVLIGQRLVIPGPSAATAAPRPGASPSARAPAPSRRSFGTRTVGGRHPSALDRSGRAWLASHFDFWAAHYGLRADLLKAICYMESGWQRTAVSPAGAVGIGQLMPDTVRFVSDQLLHQALDPRDADQNIHMTARYLRWLLDNTGGDPRRALAGYYQGLGAVRRHGVYRTTEPYLDAVRAIQADF